MARKIIEKLNYFFDSGEKSETSSSEKSGRVNYGVDPNESSDPSELSVPNLLELRISGSLPSIDYYNNTISGKKINRPTLQDLHQEKPAKMDYIKEEDITLENGIVKKGPPGPAVKFGWIIGVFIRCVLNILGPMLYLRLSWISGQAGIGLATVIICLSALVTTLTALSMCAICTNGEIRGGGSYYMLSRSLGPEFGGSMGLIFALANALAVGMHIVGFAETARHLMSDYNVHIIDGHVNDIRVIGIATLLVCFCIVLVGIDFEVKAQLVLLVILVISYINYIVGTFIPPPLWKQARGMTGYSTSTFRDNFVPEFRNEDFFSVFAVFFPATTGIMAGANISGDLKDPGTAIPKGTLLAIFTTMLTYLGGAWLSASISIRDASGNIEDLQYGNITACKYTNSTVLQCRYGIMNYFQTMEMQAAFGPLITAGIFAATLSSALACLVSGPKLLQAVGRDKLFPKLDWFAKGFGKQDEPRRAYVLCLFISLSMVCVGDLNVIAGYISNFYLATYGLINYACFDGTMAKSPGWRPTFKYFNKWTALLGTFLCVGGMFLISWIAALLTTAFILLLYIYLQRSKPNVNWGSSTQAHNYRAALKGVLKLMSTEEHVKNYRPQILALTGNPVSRPALVDFVKCVTGRNSLLMLGHIVLCQPGDKYYKVIKDWTIQIYAWMKGRKAKGFYVPVTSTSLQDGVHALLQTSGVGKLKPNVIIMGFKNDWSNCSSHELDNYFQMLHASFDCGVSVGILRVHHGLDYSHEMLETAKDEEEKWSSSSGVQGDWVPKYAQDRDSGTYKMSYSTSCLDGYQSDQHNLYHFKARHDSQIPREIYFKVNQFKGKVKKPVIDIWWLFDDGGLTLMIPYLLTHHRSYFANAKLRVFTAVSNKRPVEQEQNNFNALLEKFRIQTSNVKVINDLHKFPQLSTIAEFDRMVAPFKTESNKDSISVSEARITDHEIMAMNDRTHFHLRIRELMYEHSRDASLIVTTLPVPRKGEISSYLYMAWLDILSKDLSPVLFVRGNQQSVLTFYS